MIIERVDYCYKVDWFLCSEPTDIKPPSKFIFRGNAVFASSQIDHILNNYKYPDDCTFYTITMWRKKIYYMNRLSYLGGVR